MRWIVGVYLSANGKFRPARLDAANRTTLHGDEGDRPGRLLASRERRARCERRRWPSPRDTSEPAGERAAQHSRVCRPVAGNGMRPIPRDGCDSPDRRGRDRLRPRPAPQVLCRGKWWWYHERGGEALVLRMETRAFYCARMRERTANRTKEDDPMTDDCGDDDLRERA